MSTVEPQQPPPPGPPPAPPRGPQAPPPVWQEQDGVLRDMWLRNSTPQAIAEALGRSVPAVMTRAARLGLPRRSAPGRKPGPRLNVETSGLSNAFGSLPPRPKAASSNAQPSPQTSFRICLMCLKKFESQGRHNRICSPCKSSAEYETAGALPEIHLPNS